jgi:hypothetical protein
VTAKPGMGGDSAPSQAPGMRRGRTQQTEDWAVRRVNDVVADDLKWLFRSQPLFDYGVDAHAEVVNADDLVAGRLIGLQIKGGDSYFGEPKEDEGWVFRDNNDHLAYWLGHSLTILVVMVNNDRKAFWQVITPKTVTEHARGLSLVVPRSQPFDGTALDALLALAGRREGLLESLPRYYAVLPSAAVRPLRRAEGVEALATARLALRLADGRDYPGMTVASLAAAQPSWLTGSAAAQDLWLAVGAYAEQHGYPAETGRAFALAAACDGSRSARAWAAAGLSVVYSDRDTARDHLQHARDQGEGMLADIGAALLSIPAGDGSPAAIPPSVTGAKPEDLNTEPYAWTFLAEMAARGGELNEAVHCAENAVVDDLDTGTRLTLARMIHRRAITRDMSRRELRRALGYAQAAVEERRRWDGPSTEALAFLLDLQIPQDMHAVVRAALPASEGGTARDLEADSPDIARRGALAALATGNLAVYGSFMDKVPDGSYRRELLALESEAVGQPAEEQVATWTGLLEDAADDSMAARCVAALAKLGQWPARAEEMRDRSVFPEDAYEMLRAIYRVKTGEHDLGIAKLRELSARSALAAGELIQLLAQEDGPDTAIEEAERQVIKWPSPSLTLLLLDLVGKAGRFQRAEELIERVLQDESVPASVRQQLCNWSVIRKAMDYHQFAEAAALATRGLEIGEDSDLAWSLTKCLRNVGNVGAARQALAHHRPEPVRPEEIRLWAELHLGVSLTPDDARTMTDIAQRQPDSPLRDGIISVLVREVLLTPPAPGSPYPADVIDMVRQLSEQAQHRPGGGLPLASDSDESLRAALKDTQPDPAAYPALIAEVQGGRKSLADIARFVRRPYATVLLHRSAGIVPAADLAPGIRKAGENAAEQAIQTGSCAVDLSSLYLLSLIGDDDRLRLRSAVSTMIVARAAISDAILTRDQMRGLAIATYTAALRSDGTIERTTLTPVQQAALRDQAEALETSTSSLEPRSPAHRHDAPADTIAIAREGGFALWCDDIDMRQKARAAGVPVFSTLDLVTTLSSQGFTFDEPAMFRRLAAQYVVDLPLTATDIIAVAALSDWDRGPAHTALARPAWWRHHDSDWPSAWQQIATKAREQSAEALLDITKAGLIGALEHVTSSYRTQRYQELLVQTLVACHNTGQPPPASMLEDLAQATGPSDVPRPRFVLAALTAELERLDVQNAGQQAQILLPDISVPE